MENNKLDHSQSVTPHSQQPTANCTPNDILEGDDNTGKRTFEDRTNGNAGYTNFVKEVEFDDFFDSTPSKEDDDQDILEMLQQKNKKPKKKTVRRIYHDVSVAKELKKKQSPVKRQPAHIREKRSNASGIKDLNRSVNQSDCKSNPASMHGNSFTPTAKYFTTEEKVTANLDFGAKVDMAQRK